MIEIPRAALTADDIAKEADFFCFGTNDLTQMTYGFSRDDAGKFLDAYYDAKIFENDPFAKLDQVGVGKLMEMAIKLGKSTNPDLHIGICGEHGGFPYPYMMDSEMAVVLRIIHCTIILVVHHELAHGGAKPPRRYELLGGISLLSPEYLLSFERR